jgi:fibronectin-binding autotransporter adhesin
MQAAGYSLFGNGLSFGSPLGIGSITNNSAANIGISNQISSSVPLIFSGTGSGTLNLLGPINSNQSITKTSAGTLFLGAANNGFTGLIGINSGVVRLGNAASLQNSTVVVNVDGGLDLNGLAAVTIGALFGNGNLALGNTTLNVGTNNGSTNYTGVLSTAADGTGTLAKMGFGELTLHGSGSVVDRLILSEGQLTVVGTAATLTAKRAGTTMLRVGSANLAPTLRVLGGATLVSDSSSCKQHQYGVRRGRNHRQCQWHWKSLADRFSTSHRRWISRGRE